jgi:hypothetical protein
MNQTRRDLLAGISGAATLTMGGCLSGSKPLYRIGLLGLNNGFNRPVTGTIKVWDEDELQLERTYTIEAFDPPVAPGRHIREPWMESLGEYRVEYSIENGASRTLDPGKVLEKAYDYDRDNWALFRLAGSSRRRTLGDCSCDLAREEACV